MNLPCAECKATCCKGHRGVLQDDGSILLFIDNRCPNLDEHERCVIYESRPKSCRAFDCSQEPGFLRVHQRIAALLTLHGVPFATEPNA